MDEQESTVFDYDNQAWLVNGHYVRCGHKTEIDCGCYGKEFEGFTPAMIFEASLVPVTVSLNGVA